MCRKRWAGLVLLGLVMVLQLAACGAGGDPDVVEPEADGAVELARQALVEFFDRLHAGDYAGASELYGGSYEVLIGYNPDLDPQDHEALFRKACTINGAQCLKVRRAVPEGRVAGNGFRFLVEFQHDNGAPFLLGPCCGANETDQPPQSRFLYTVERSNEGSYLVLNRPVYVP
jgi:hypothetical protein